MKKIKSKKAVQYFFQFLFLFWVISFCMKFKAGGVAGLVEFLERNYILSIFIICFLYIFKSFVFILPVSILLIAVGVVYSPLEAVIINTAGYCLEVTAGYLFGYYFGSDFMEKGFFRKKSFLKLFDKLSESKIGTILLFRFLPCFPNDVMSTFLGASKVNFKNYMTGSLLGFFPWIIGYVLVGQAGKGQNVSFVFVLPLLFMVMIGGIGIWILKEKKAEKVQG